MRPLPILRKLLTLTVLLFIGVGAVSGQSKIRRPVKIQSKVSPVNNKNLSVLLTEFMQTTANADVVFTPPKGFREVRPVNNEYFTFDYAMDIPGHGFEVWYHVISQKENWASFEKGEADENGKLQNPDSVFSERGRALAAAFTGEQSLFVRDLPPNVLKRYNADIGKSYLLPLLDMPETKRYQYALLIALQKLHTATVFMICFTNNKNPEFYKNVENAGGSLKFKSAAAVKPAAQIVDKLTD